MECTHKWKTLNVLLDNAGNELQNCICEYCDEKMLSPSGNDSQLKDYQEIAENMLGHMQDNVALFHQDELMTMRWLINEVKACKINKQPAIEPEISPQPASVKFIELF